MKIGVIPTKYGYSAIALPPYDGNWELSTPVKLPYDVLVQLRGQILHKLALYCQSLSVWQVWKIVLPWAAWGGLAMYFRWARLLDSGIKFLLLYGWVMLFFFADGIRLLAQLLCHTRGLIDAYRIREGAATGQWVSTREGFRGDNLMPSIEDTAYHVNPEASERGFIQTCQALYPVAKPYYDEMLREEPPFLFSAYPLGFFGYLHRMFVGPRYPRPGLIFELGDLQ